MADSWIYSELKPLREGRPHQFLQELFNQIFLWSKNVVKTHKEFPAGYTEWTMAGHFAVAASQLPLRCFSYQDYSIKLTNPHKRKGKIHVMRPDLHLRQKDWENACMFEFKRMFIPLNPSKRRDFAKSTFELMKDAHSQLVRMTRGDWANLLCSTVGMTTWLDYMVNGKDRWAVKWQNENGYVNAWDALLYDKIVPALKSRSDTLEEFGRLYYCGYRMPHSLVVAQHNSQEKEWAKETNKDSRKLRTFPIGMVWVLAVKEFPKL